METIGNSQKKKRDLVSGRNGGHADDACEDDGADILQCRGRSELGPCFGAAGRRRRVKLSSDVACRAHSSERDSGCAPPKWWVGDTLDREGAKKHLVDEWTRRRAEVKEP